MGKFRSSVAAECGNISTISCATMTTFKRCHHFFILSIIALCLRNTFAFKNVSSIGERNSLFADDLVSQQISCLSDIEKMVTSKRAEVLIITNNNQQYQSALEKQVLVNSNERGVSKMQIWDYRRIKSMRIVRKWRVLWFIDMAENDLRVDQIIVALSKELFIFYADNGYVGNRIELFARLQMLRAKIHLIVWNASKYGACEFYENDICSEHWHRSSDTILMEPEDVHGCILNIQTREYQPYVRYGGNKHWTPASGIELLFLKTIESKMNLKLNVLTEKDSVK